MPARFVRRSTLPMWELRLVRSLAQGTTPHQWRTRLGAHRCVRCGEAKGSEVGEIYVVPTPGAPEGVGACQRCQLAVLEALAILTPASPCPPSTPSP